LGKGILSIVDQLFWNLPFASPTQSHAVRKKAGISEEDWETKWKEMMSDHDLPQAREELASGWKVYLMGADALVQAGAVHPKPVSLLSEVVDDSDD